MTVSGVDDWVERLVRDLKGSLPGMVLLSLDITDDGALVIGVLRVPVDSRGGWHGPRMLLAILAAADARGLDVVCSPTDAYGSDRRALVRALDRAGFVLSPDDPSGHTMRRPSPASGRGRTVAGMTETRDQGAGTAAAGWDCEAYGPEGAAVGALCFFSEGARVCRTAGECSSRMAGERGRVFGVIREKAEAGDPVFAYVAAQFTSPDQLLGGPEAVEGVAHRFLPGGDDATFGAAGIWCAVWVRTAGGPDQCGRPPEAHPPGGAVSLAEAMREATEDPSCGVVRLECAPDVVGFLRSLAPDEPPSPPWRPAPIVPLGSVPVVTDDTLPVGQWRMVDAGGGVVWEGALEQ